ncbi:MAG: TlpA disulfide reductase family protein [Bacteroidota bacterium]
MKSFLLLVCGLFLLVGLHAQQINLKLGEEFAIKASSTETLVATNKLTNSEEYVFQFKVLGRTDNEYRLECRLLKVKVWEEDKRMRLNTDSIAHADLNHLFILSPLILMQGSITYIIDTRGRFLRLEGVDELVNQVSKKWHLKEDESESQRNNLSTFLKMYSKLFFELPDQKIAYQSVWKSDNGRINYTVTAIRGSLLDITATSDNPTTQEKYLLNDVNGLVEDANISFTKGAKAIQYGRNQTLIYGRADASNVDTAWLNMAMPLSRWSDAFTPKNVKVDSPKVVAYMNKYDVLYKDDPYYVNGILDLVSKFKRSGKLSPYKLLLAKTPNKLIDNDNVHLFNKVLWAKGVDVDSAYNVIQYLYKYPRFNDWIQWSFSQNVQNTDDVIANQLMEKLKIDKRPEMQQSIRPMYLWAIANREPKNSVLLLKTYKQLMGLNDAYIKKGNGGRYMLLTYKMLAGANKRSEANKLLDKTIQTLERFTADTLNQNIYTDKNMLAYAFYLKYQGVAKKDSIAALQYLAKAAQYSPKKDYEKTYLSSYDHIFLNSKESYIDDFMNKLFELKNDEAVLKVIADNITANPANIAGMQSIYQKHFPNDSFSSFFINKVVSSWNNAPAFELTDINGKKLALADYKNRWLVIDFWGTWCGPCRDEMPKVNAFNSQLNAGRYRDVNFLSIACYDTQSSVKKFVTNNNYSIPVAMSDNIVQRSYKIFGYPTKVLVAPNGKMISLPFGADWQSLTRKFNELYAVN